MARDNRGVSEENESIAPLRMQQLASSVPWSLVALILIYGGMAGGETKDLIIGFGGAALATLVAFRAARMRMVLTPTEVHVVGWVNAKRIPWSEVERFLLTDKGIAIKLRGGLEERVGAFAVGGALFKSVRQSQLADLQGILERAERYRRKVRRDQR